MSWWISRTVAKAVFACRTALNASTCPLQEGRLPRDHVMEGTSHDHFNMSSH